MEHEVYEFPVPEGFDPILRPTKAENRIPTEKIVIEYVEPEDLVEYVGFAGSDLETNGQLGD